MSPRKGFKLLRGSSGSASPENGNGSGPTVGGFLEHSPYIGILIFIATAAAIVAISSVGISTTNLPIAPEQLATARVVASTTFSYVSQERTEAGREAVRNQLPPVYRLDFSPLQAFEANFRDLLTGLTDIETRFPAGNANVTGRAEALEALVEQFNLSGPYGIGVEDAVILLDSGDAEWRRSLADSGLAILREIYTEGVYDASLGSGAGPNSTTVFQVMRPDGDTAQRQVQSLEQALTYLRINLAAEGTERELATPLYRILRSGITPNLVYDRAATEQRLDAALAAIGPVTVSVERGQTIIEPDTRVTPEQYEMLLAQRQHLRESGDTVRDENQRLFSRVMLVIAMVVACTFYIRLEDIDTLRSNSRLGLLALVVIGNFALVRLTYSLLDTDFFTRNRDWASALPYIAPTALAPLIVAILIDAGSAIFMALLLSMFTALIYGNRLDLLVATFLAAMIAIFMCRDARKRGRVVRAAITGGLIVAAFAALIGFVERSGQAAILLQMGAALITGLFTGVLVVGILPVLESLFRRATGITLLELTDSNHPLLRKMQLNAPGTYHHSLVVAQLAENACNAIGANPLLARICALFHDVGKTLHPEFFTENQRSSVNPHDTMPPAESARVIKAHVTEGAELAERHGLPQPVIDVIRQHHGTSLLRIFYQRACDSRSPHPPEEGIAEQDYRYDGPLPQFKESAVIALADSVEAATRSLREVSREQLDDLIEHIFQERVADRQLDEAPLTLGEFSLVKDSFIYTLLNMLHSRVAYAAAPTEGTDPSPAKA